MNQILMTENKKKEKKQKSSGEQADIKSIIKFFAMAMIIFGVTLVGGGSYAIYKEVDDRKPANLPKVTIGRVNDSAIVYVDHKEEISKIIYRWDNGEETILPEGSTTAQEEILLPAQNSVLHLTIEDMNGKQMKYQKLYDIEGMDIQKPELTIEQSEKNSKKLVIKAVDETEMSYIKYRWDGEEAVIVDAETEGQKEIVVEIDLEPGTRKITVIAEDLNGNVEKKEQEIVTSTSEPKVQAIQEGKYIIIEAYDEDGIKDILLNLNGQELSSNDINKKYVKAGPVELKEGNNIILVEVTNVNGYTKKVATEYEYTP